MKKQTLNPPVLFVFLALVSLPLGSMAYSQSGLEAELLGRDPKELAQLSIERGNASRGALLFHAPWLGCAKCHRVDDGKSLTGVGPNLAKWNRKVDNLFLVNSLLRPSEHIEEAYRSIAVVTIDGETYTGVEVSRDNGVLRLGVATENQREEIPLSNIQQEKFLKVSIMPTGQVNALQQVGQFYDLVAYLIAIRDGGVEQAKQLQPSADSLKLKLPEYETRVDHAGLIGKLDQDSFERGKAIYAGLCVQCHGTLEAPGSLPTALRFAEGKFKRGNDPYSIYHTLTHGTGLMLPQIWMVPRQKYDVAHYLREHFVKQHSKYPLSEISEAYLKSLPVGDTEGPEPQIIEPWRTMDYGPMLSHTIEIGKDASNIAQKGIAIRLDQGVGGIAAGRAWALFEHDTLRMAGMWTGDRFIDWQGIQFNGAHGIHPRAVGELLLENKTGPGWAKPGTRSFNDNERVQGRDQRRYGPLPKEWGKYQGALREGDEVLFRYTVGSTEIYESPNYAMGKLPSLDEKVEVEIFGRAFYVGERKQELTMSVAMFPKDNTKLTLAADMAIVEIKAEGGKEWFVAGFDQKVKGIEWSLDEGRLCLSFPKDKDGQLFTLAMGRLNVSDFPSLGREASEIDWEKIAGDIAPIAKVLSVNHGEFDPQASSIWKSVDTTQPKVWFEQGAWGVDELTLPLANPWRARIRVTGLDFYSDGDSIAICTWDGDVWKGTGLRSLGTPDASLKWRRIASGLFQPLGIIVLEDQSLMVTCRDQLMQLRDENKDGEMEEMICFNSDHQVTEHFHEFAMGLQRDSQGRWLYAKSARHALKAVVPQHGTLLRVAADGSKTELLATGFRAANGVCLNDDGTFIVTDQEGHWNPKNRINWVREGGFYGNMFGYHDVTDSSDQAMQQPLCWITNQFDRSPAELLWVPKDGWGSLGGSLLNLSYGYGRVYVVPFEKGKMGEVEQHQGGMCQLPIPDLPTGIIRGRFSPTDHQLYVGGMFAWASSRQDQEGGLYRIRRLDQPADLPTQLHAHRNSIDIGWTDPLDAVASREIDRYQVRAWGLKRTANYGSDHIDEHSLEILAAKVLEDGKTLRILFKELKPTWGMSIKLRLRTGDGREVEREIHNTIHWQAD